MEIGAGTVGADMSTSRRAVRLILTVAVAVAPTAVLTFAADGPTMQNHADPRLRRRLIMRTS
jgi:hypothetical protein